MIFDAYCACTVVFDLHCIDVFVLCGTAFIHLVQPFVVYSFSKDCSPIKLICTSMIYNSLKATMSDEGEKSCPLCAEEMDLTDQQLKPCKCGYEVTTKNL